MNTQNLNLFGFQSDNDEALVAQSLGNKKLGLNHGYKIVKMEVRAEDMQGKPNPSINLEWASESGDKLFSTIYGSVTVYDNNNNIRTDVDSPDYQEKFAKEFAQTRAVLTHLCKQASNDADYQAKYNAAGIDSVQKLFNFSAGIIQGMINSGKVFDVFLQYQWSLKGDKTKTFLELPKNLKYGYFLAPDSSGQKWNEVKTESNLYYENERGERHIFERAKNFLDSPLAAEQNTGGKNQDAMAKQANAMNATTGKSDSKNWL